MLKGLLFDLDGVLADTAQYHLLAWRELAERLNIDLPAAADADLRGRSRLDSLNLLLQYGHELEQFSAAEKASLMAEKNRHYQALVKRLTPQALLPGIADLLAAAQADGVMMAVASSSQNAPLILDQLGIADFFAGVADPTKVQHGKPAPDIYQAAQALLGLDADEVIGFEDAPAGVAAIKAAGQFAVGIGDDWVLRAADIIVPTTADLNYGQLKQAFNAD